MECPKCGGTKVERLASLDQGPNRRFIAGCLRCTKVWGTAVDPEPERPIGRRPAGRGRALDDDLDLHQAGVPSKVDLDGAAAIEANRREAVLLLRAFQLTGLCWR